MFEHDILSDCSADTGLDGEKRPFDWAELVMRLAAARDARAALRSHRVVRSASFSAGAAGLLQDDNQLRINNERPVNPDALGHGKPNDGRTADVANSAVTADRETV